ncbi:MAG: primosomal protein N' [Gammaproteobacteria bacterium]|nr:primosomal protein N' [Gammaproteobacteria bacterium]
MPDRHVLQVAVPVPLRRLFDYLPAVGDDTRGLLPGRRVRVPFGRRRLVGIVVGAREGADRGVRLRRIERVLDDAPLWTAAQLDLLRWAARYYHHPLGEVLFAALPAALRKGQPARSAVRVHWRLTAPGRNAPPEGLARAPRQARVRAVLEARGEAGASAAQLGRLEGDWRGALRGLVRRGWAEPFQAVDAVGSAIVQRAPRHHLNDPQHEAVEAIGRDDGFTPWLLDGVTGSGKTEVYLHAIERVVERGLQALLLVPEIGLTPQLLDRVAGHFGRRPAVLHSGLADGERLAAWFAARDGSADVVVGTRSAVFVPLARPGLIVVDEEHDPSYKQQDGFRYHARDVAVVRARSEKIPVLLGSATPSLESLHNVRRERYRLARLPARAAGAELPAVELVDLRGRTLTAGLSPRLLQALGEALDSGRQAMVFLNRRGYATTLICHDCGWIAGCRRCDARMTLHLARGRLCCHHCGSERPPERRCPDCGGDDLRPLGQGTERLEAALAERFGESGLVRIDRDTTRRKGSLDAKLAEVHSGDARLLVGTQMLAKGHHFPGVTLVGVVNADAGLFGSDFRAAERIAQQMIQVVGRAGRAARPGRVLVQTHHPEHPLLQVLVRDGYHAFAEATLEERRLADLPPWTHLALLRAEAHDADAPLAFLEDAKRLVPPVEGVEVLGPVPAPMARRGGRQRAQLLLQSSRRNRLQGLLGVWLERLEALPEARRVRWSLDVDPIELF